jgi:hypothetical protein
MVSLDILFYAGGSHKAEVWKFSTASPFLRRKHVGRLQSAPANSKLDNLA